MPEGSHRRADPSQSGDDWRRPVFDRIQADLPSRGGDRIQAHFRSRGGGLPDAAAPACTVAAVCFRDYGGTGRGSSTLFAGVTSHSTAAVAGRPLPGVHGHDGRRGSEPFTTTTCGLPGTQTGCALQFATCASSANSGAVAGQAASTQRDYVRNCSLSIRVTSISRLSTAASASRPIRKVLS
jgi:hypothetical protein